MDGKLGNDVGEKKMSVVFGGGIHTVLGQQAGPRECHQPPQFVTLFPESFIEIGQDIFSVYIAPAKTWIL